MSRYKLIRALLIVGVVAGFGSGFARIHHMRQHGHHHYCHGDRQEPAPPPGDRQPAPPTEAAPR